MIGIILKRKNVREYDQIISFLSDDGEKKEVLARGVKKITSKNSPFLEPGSLLEIETAEGKETEHLIRVSPLNLFKKIREDILKIFGTNYVLGITAELLSPGEKDVRVFDFLKSWLDFVNEEAAFADILVDSYLIKLATLLGFKPVLEKCVIGEEELKNEVSFFSLSLGGVVCASCKNTLPPTHGIIFSLNTSEQAYFSELINSEWPKISGLELNNKISEIIYQFVKYHTEKIPGQWSNFKNKTALVRAGKS